MIQHQKGTHVKASEVRVEGIGKSFGDVQVLRDVSVTVKPGEFFSLLGPSGCGKTTLLRIIAGFESPSRGALFLDNADVLGTPSNKRHVNTVFQNYALFPHLTVFENVAFSQRLKKIPQADITQKVGEYLELVRLNEHARKMPFQLSGGQKQRVSIARALINEPSVLLLDEPLSALDAKLRQELLVELDAIHDKIGITFIYVTHDQQEAISISDRVAVMNQGRILQIGTPLEIYERPADPFVAGFIGDTNLLGGTVDGIDGGFMRVDVPGTGTVLATISPACTTGSTVQITVRPERIRITRDPPSADTPGLTMLPGEVTEVIYSGFQSKFFVRSDAGTMFQIVKQHHGDVRDDTAVKWKDRVWICWGAGDGYIVGAAPR